MTSTKQCAAHGAFEGREFMPGRWSTCPRCQAEDRARRDAAAAEQMKAERRHRNMAASGLVGRFASAGFETYIATTQAQRDLVDVCRRYAEGFRVGTQPTPWLIGRPGTGKTHLAAAIVRHLIEEHELPARMHSGREIVRMLRAFWGIRSGGVAWDGTPQSEGDLLRELINAPLLVLDEIGVGFGTEAEQTQLFDIVDGRYQREAPTMLASNLTAGEIKAAVGDRIFDRLREGARVYVLDWPSNRRSA